MIVALLSAILTIVGVPAPAPATCSAPLVMLTGNDKALTVRFWAGTPGRRNVEGNIRAAFKSACKHGLLKGSTIAKLHGVSLRRLYVSNAPNANVASLYDRNGKLVLEYPFVAADRTMYVPSAKDIQEAIFCAVHGASAKEQE